MKRNKSQIVFFLLCLVLGALLLLFLYKNRQMEHERTARLEQEAASSIDADADESSAAVTESTAAPDSGAAVSSAESTAASAAAQNSGTEAAAAVTAEPTAAPAAAEPAAAEETTAADPENAAAASDETAIAALAAGAPQIRLTTHSVTIPVGGTFSYMQYIASMTDDKDNHSTLARRVELSGSVNTAAAGTYSITYTVRDTDGNMSNQPTLTVTVQ